MTEQERQKKIAAALGATADLLAVVERDIGLLAECREALRSRMRQLSSLCDEFEAGRYLPKSAATETSGDAEGG